MEEEKTSVERSSMAEVMTPSAAVDSLQTRQDLECRQMWSAFVVVRPRTSATQLRSSSPTPDATSTPAPPLASAPTPTSPRSSPASSSLPPYGPTRFHLNVTMRSKDA